MKRVLQPLLLVILGLAAGIVISWLAMRGQAADLQAKLESLEFQLQVCQQDAVRANNKLQEYRWPQGRQNHPTEEQVKASRNWPTSPENGSGKSRFTQERPD